MRAPKTLVVLVLVVIGVLLAQPGSAQQLPLPCSRPHEDRSCAMQGEVAGGELVIRQVDAERCRRSLQRSSNSTDRQAAQAGLTPPGMPILELLTSVGRAEGAGVVVLGTMTELGPIPIDGVWKGPDALACTRAFLEAGGLAIAAPTPFFWVIGPPKEVRTAPVVVSAYSLDEQGQPLRDNAEARRLEEALLAWLPIPNPFLNRELQDPVWIGLGTYRVPGERNTLIVERTIGSSTCCPPHNMGGTIRVEAYKVSIEEGSGRPRIECHWGARVYGPLVAGIAEDLDNDGYRDFVFQEEGENIGPTLVVSGREGSELAELATSSIAVETRPSTVARLAADYEWGQGASHLVVLQYSPEKKRFERIDHRLGEGKVSAAQASAMAHANSTASALGALVGGEQNVRVYVLPGMNAHARGAEVIRLPRLKAWPEWVATQADPLAVLAARDPSIPVRVMVSYVPPDYVPRDRAHPL